MFSQTSEYALRIASFLSNCEGQAVTVTAIAAKTQVPRDYLYKILTALKKKKLVTAQRGRGGGLQLARPAKDINLLQIFEAVDPIHRITACPLGLPEHADKLCAMHSQLDAAIAATERILNHTTLDRAQLELKTLPPLPCTGACRTGKGKKQ